MSYLNRQGTTTNDSAVAGNVGEYIESIFSTVSPPSTGVWQDSTSISLTPGDWDVTLNMNVQAQGGTVTGVLFGISSTSGNSGTGLVVGSNRNNIFIPTASTDAGGSIAAYRVSISATTTYYAKFLTVYSLGAGPFQTGRLSARRVR